MLSFPRAFACMALALATAQCAAAADTAKGCQKTHDLDDVPKNDGALRCQTLVLLAECLTNVPIRDVGLKAALAFVEEAQETLQDCTFSVTPRLQVVDRQLRVVSNEDIEFQRFRRDTVGVFELKENIASLVGKVDQAVKDAAAVGTKASADTKKSSAAIEKSSAAIDVNTKAIDEVKKSMVAISAKLDATAKEAAGSKDPLLSEKIYWLALDQSVAPTNEPAMEMNFVGIGFEAYFNPLFPNFFKCTYTDAKKNKVETAGKVVSGEDKIAYFSVVCDAPPFVKVKTEYTASLSYEDADGVKSIPFKGVKGRNVMTFSMVWTAGKMVGAALIVDVSGLDEKAKYSCEYTDAVNSKIKKTQPATFVGSKYKLSCGKVPTGLTIQSEKSTAKVFLKIFVSGTSNQVVYAGKHSNDVYLDMCLNGATDGSETDTDCGGACGGCGPKGKCKADGDCKGGKCSKGKCGGGPGTSKEESGESCKQIKRDFNPANGRYWVRGFGAGEVKDAFKVYCWMQERDGGGWALIQSNWYKGSGEQSNRIGDYGSIDNSRMFHARGHAYKLADTKIRAVIGQSQKAGVQSKFDYMGDQAGVNNAYSYVNIEHAITYNYNADWFSTPNPSTNKPMKESSTQTEMKIFLLRSGSRSNPNTPGVGSNKAEGEVAWTGRPTCGGRGKTGINCYNTYNGSPGRSPHGGQGCKFRRDRQRWNHPMEYYMANTNSDTYMYNCNGPQHSSGFNMNHRWWIRSAKGSADE